ncbi:phage major capsid protein [Kitasatospora acidiphila]|uniref:phage major capsid protein n=1 Tax=Kitasatospora acidiphila TaxID=2567942 RepID=UPI0015F0848E|nr:phage major capsid protein [Kitasatospora acidiphila]
MATNPFSGGQYGSGVYRNAGSPAGGEALVPTPVSAEIIQELPTASAILQRARPVRMSALTQRQPVLSVLPQAYFLNSGGTPGGADFALKSTTQQQWKNVNLVAEELAVIVPIPMAYLDDAQVDIWAEVRPRIVEAFGIAIDAACLFGVNRPTTWSTDIYTAATAAGNTVTPQTMTGANEADLGVAVTQMGASLVKQGFSINGFVTAPGFGWTLAGYRSPQGLPIYQPNPDNTPGGRLYGFDTAEALNGAFDPTKASLIAGNWGNAIVGLRQDITFTMHTDGVIQDASGAIVLNLMQEDSVALRCVMRLGFATANPVTALGQKKGTYYPFSVMTSVPQLT